MSEKHTPGPWHTDESTGLIPVFILPNGTDDTRFAVGRAEFQNYHPDGIEAAKAECRANARLIASAPRLKSDNETLLYALEWLVREIKSNDGYGMKGALAAAEGAIAKAKA